MMWYNFKIEWRRYFQEMIHFKFNLFFANTGLIVFFLGLLDYLHVDNKETILLLLFVWYFATHGFININFIIEEEIMDGTFVHILESRVSFLNVIFLRSFIQVVYDLIKAIPVFGCILLIGHFDYSWLTLPSLILIILLICLSIFTSYCIGLIIGALTLKFKKLSALPTLLYYFVLFFGGITYDITSFPPMEFIAYGFPFLPLRFIIDQLQLEIVSLPMIFVLIVQAVIYLILGVVLYRIIMKENFKNGRSFYV